MAGAGAFAGVTVFASGLTFWGAAFLGAAFFATAFFATTFFAAVLRLAGLARFAVFFFLATGLRAADFLADDLRAATLRDGFFAFAAFEALLLADFLFLDAGFAISVHSLSCHGDYGEDTVICTILLMDRVSKEVKAHVNERSIIPPDERGRTLSVLVLLRQEAFVKFYIRSDDCQK